MKNKKTIITISLVALTLAICATPCFAGLESSLVNIKTKLIGVILPVLSVIGIAFAAMSLFSGNPNGKQHVMYAIIGSIIGFGAQAIIDFISQTIR